jgi:hypothetical protein
MNIINLFGTSAAILSAMTIDNIFWISASPEYKDYKKYSLLEKTKYIIFKRVIPVWTNWRDLTPALIIGAAVMLIT